MNRETRKAKFLEVDIYPVTCERLSAGRSNLEVLHAIIEGGARVIQLREKEYSGKDLYQLALQFREITSRAGVLLLINDHLDIAMAVAADGVHLGQDDLPLEKVRKLAGGEMFIGLSTHSPAQAEAAVRLGVDYIGVGPIFATNTKKDVCDPVGLEYLDYVVRNIRLPFVAIGGIKEHNIAEVYRRGARCIALVTEIVGAPDIGVKVHALRAAIGSASL